MFYRRKILLALVASFGGSLSERNCHLLLYLFCLRRNKNFYDFFPYKESYVSLILRQDKNRLINLGFLAPEQDFQINREQLSSFQLLQKDATVLQSLITDFKGVQSEEFAPKISLIEASSCSDNPQASRKLMSGTGKLEQQERTEADCLFTIGYEGLSIDAYLNILLENHVTTLVDVRKNPLSRKYGFSKTQLTSAMQMVGIAYIHLPDLGVPSSLRRGLNSDAAYQKLFDYYSAHILPAHLDAIQQLKTILLNEHRTVLTCFEANPIQCHRHRIVEYLENDPDFQMPFVHLNTSQIKQNAPSNLEIEHLFNGLLV